MSTDDEVAEYPLSFSEIPALPFFGADLLLWLWFSAENGQGKLVIPHDGEEREVLFWVDDKLVLAEESGGMQATIAGDAAPSAPEAFLALREGKRVGAAEVVLQVVDRQYAISLGSDLEKGLRVKLPPSGSLSGDGDAVVERMLLFDELWTVLSACAQRYARHRLSPGWPATLEAMAEWMGKGGRSRRDESGVSEDYDDEEG